MKDLYKILRLFFCPHKYESIGEHEVFQTRNYSLPIRIEYVSRCKYCGKIKKTKI